MIEFQLDTASGVATYLQLVQQVHQALQLGLLEPGDQLPTAQQVVAKLAINPNTVLKAYRDLEREGLVRARPGQGTFVIRSLPRTDPATQARFLASMTDWLRSARSAGLGPGRHRGDLPHRGPQLLRGGGGMTAVLETSGLGKRYGRRWALQRLHPRHPRRARSSGSSGPTGRARPPCCIWPSGCSRRPRARSRCSADVPVTARRNSDGSASSPRTRRCTRGCRWPITSAWAPGSTRRWDGELAERRIEQLGLDPRQRAGSLSGGQRAQLALTLAIAKRPELLAPRRAGGQLGPARPARVPAKPHGGRRRARGQRRALLASRRRPRAGL